MSERIEGVPVGTKLAKVALAEDISIGSDRMFKASIRLVPDNVYGVIDLSTAPGMETLGKENHELSGDMSEAFHEVNPHSGLFFLSRSGLIVPATAIANHRGPDRRRIHVRPIKPKTRRVLVETFTRELRIINNGWGCADEVNIEIAENMARNYPNKYRIEERPIDG